MLRNNDNIHLKENEIFYRIQNTEQLYKAIRIYGVKVLNSDRNKYGVKICQRLRKRENLEKITIIEGLDYGKNNLLFENTNIIVNINQIGKPLINDVGTQFHSEMEVQILNNENTLEENRDIAKIFFKKCIEHFTEQVLDKKKEPNRTMIYIWDEGYWETLEKGVSRKMCAA